MNFGVVDSEDGRPPGQRQPSGQGPPSSRPPLQLPTWQEVQAAKQPSAPTILFRPTGLVTAALQQQQHQPLQLAHQPAGQQPPGATGPQPPAPQQRSLSAPPAALPGAAAGWPQQGVPPAQVAHSAGAVHGAAAAGHTAGLARAGPGPGYSGPSGPGYPGGANGGGGGGGAPGPSGGGGGGGGLLGPAGVAPYSAPRPPGGYGAMQQPSGPIAPAAPPPNVVLVHRRQQGNPLLKHIRNVRWQFGDIVPDYQLGQNTAALFLSLRYHLLHPDYILHRIREQQRLFRLTVLLVHVDVEELVARPLGEVTRAAVAGDCTLVCAWSHEECARWLETYKSYESKPASSIQERVEPDYVSRLAAVLAGSVRGVNRTDAHTLGSSFGSLAAMMRCKDADAFSACPGIGPTKVRRLLEAFHQPFRKQLKMTGVGATSATAGAAARAVSAGAAAAPGASQSEATATATAATGAAAAPAAASSRPATWLGASSSPEGQGPAAGFGRGALGSSGGVSEGPGGGCVGGADAGMGALGRGEAHAAGVQDQAAAAGTGDRGGGSREQQHHGRQPDEGDQGKDEAGGAGGQVNTEAAVQRRQQLLELLMSQMPVGDDDVSDGDEDDYRT